MNKDIKFRAFHKNLKGGLFVVCSIDFDQQKVKLQRGELFVTADFSEVDIVRFTGLLDKNNKEIFEGDVINGNLGDRKSDVFTVVFSGGSFDVANGRFANYCLCDVSNREIICNIFENPFFKIRIH